MEMVDDVVHIRNVGLPVVFGIYIVTVAVIVGFDDRRSRNTIGRETMGQVRQRR